jgi:hypothetical protein
LHYHLTKPDHSTSNHPDDLKADDATKDFVTQQKSSDDQSSSLNPKDLALRSADYQGSSTSRTAAYVKNQVDNQVPHRDPSTQPSIQDHTGKIAAVVEDCETALKMEQVSQEVTNSQQGSKQVIREYDQVIEPFARKSN